MREGGTGTEGEERGEGRGNGKGEEGNWTDELPVWKYLIY